MNATDLRRARLLLGMALVLLLFLAETVVAHQTRPHPASPWLWAALGTGALGCIAAAAWLRLRARRAGTAEAGDAGGGTA